MQAFTSHDQDQDRGERENQTSSKVKRGWSMDGPDWFSHSICRLTKNEVKLQLMDERRSIVVDVVDARRLVDHPDRKHRTFCVCITKTKWRCQWEREHSMSIRKSEEKVFEIVQIVAEHVTTNSTMDKCRPLRAAKLDLMRPFSKKCRDQQDNSNDVHHPYSRNIESSFPSDKQNLDEERRRKIEWILKWRRTIVPKSMLIEKTTADGTRWLIKNSPCGISSANHRAVCSRHVQFWSDDN